MSEPSSVVVPPMLYLPVLDHPEGGQLAVVKKLSDGRQGLLAYTALDRLADKCGARQPWVLVATADLERIKAAQPFDVVAFDLAVPPAHLVDGRLA